MRRKRESTGDAIRSTRSFSFTVLVAGIAACTAGAITENAVPIVLGAGATVSGAVLVTFTYIAQRRSHF